MDNKDNQTPPLVELPNYHDIPDPSPDYVEVEPSHPTTPISNQTKIPVNVDGHMMTRRIQSGASWISMVGILSFVNTLLTLFKATLRFTIGLGLTTLIDYFAFFFMQRSPDNRTLFIVINVGINLMIALIFVVLGWFAKRENGWAYLTAIILYSIDTFIMIWLQNWMGVIFHLVALVIMVMGYIALRKKQKLVQGPNLAGM